MASELVRYEMLQGIADLLQIRHSGERRNPENSQNWAPVFTGATNTAVFP